MKKATRIGEELHIKFFVPSGDFSIVLQQVKALTGRRWDAGQKLWVAPCIQENIDFLKMVGFEVEGIEDKPLPFVIQSPRKEVDRSKLPSNLRPYQIEAIEFMEAVNWRGFISLAPRMGKSICALCGWMLHDEFAPILIICPASVKINWQREIYKWTKKKAHIISGTTPYPLPNVRFYIINYDILHQWRNILPKPEYLIADECFPYKTRITTEDGIKELGWMCNHRYSGKVLAFNTDNMNWEYKHVTNWISKHTNETIKIFTSTCAYIECTPNHNIYILRNGISCIKRADEITIDDRIIAVPRNVKNNGIAPDFGYLQYQAILGMALGDASLQMATNMCRLSFTQGDAQKEYLQYKVSILHNMIGAGRKLRRGVSGYNTEKAVWMIATKCSTAFTDLRKKLYPKGILSISNVIEDITPITLAFWYMDDGHISTKWNYCDLSTHSFTEEENKLILKMLEDKFGICGFLKYEKRCNKYYIAFHSEATRKLSALVAPYIPECMQYKLCPNDRGKFINLQYDTVKYSTMAPIRIERVYHEKPLKVFDITVEDNHNYLVGEGCLVSNCHRVSNVSMNKIVQKKTVKVPVKCTEAFRTLAKNTPHIAMLSGTPATSRVWQLWVGLNILAPNEFSNEYKFKWRYCDPKHTGFGYVFEGLSNGEELHAKLSRFMYRKTREEVFTDLPEESHEFVQVEIDMKAYEADLNDFKKWYAKHKDISDEELEEKLSSFASLGYSKKRTAIIEWITDFCESGEQIVVFAWHRDVVEDLFNAFRKKAVMMYGGMGAVLKQKAIDDFNAGKKQIFIANIASAKEGITLAGANTVAYVEFPRTAGDLEQSSQRVWLPGKQNKLQYIYFCAVDLEEARIDKLRKRAKILSKALDGVEVEIMTDRVREMLE
jgi:recombination protein RecA